MFDYIRVNVLFSGKAFCSVVCFHWSKGIRCVQLSNYVQLQIISPPVVLPKSQVTFAGALSKSMFYVILRVLFVSKTIIAIEMKIKIIVTK